MLHPLAIQFCFLPILELKNYPFHTLLPVLLIPFFVLSWYLKYPGKKGNDVDDHPEIPVKLRVEMWLGLEKQQQYWTGRPKTEGDFCVFAETVRSDNLFSASRPLSMKPRVNLHLKGGTREPLDGHSRHFENKRMGWIDKCSTRASVSRFVHDSFSFILVREWSQAAWQVDT